VKIAIATGLAIASCICLGCATGQTTVTRIVDSELVAGRYISPEAYGSYVRGAYLEAHGDLGNAIHAYAEATRRDPENPDAWTTRGAVNCALTQRGVAAPAIDRAQRLDAESALLWRERARCALALGELPVARQAAERAAAAQPQSVETSLLLSDIYDRLGLTDEATRWLDALVVWQPDSVIAWQASFDHAARRRDRRRLLAAAQALLRLRPERRDELTRALPELGPRPSIDAALLEGRLGLGRATATEVGMSAAELAVRAAALGQSNLAREQAELVLAADPNDGDAWVALLAAETPAAKPASGLSAMLDPSRPGWLSIRLLALVLADRVGPAVARTWLAAWSPLPEPADELELELVRKLSPQAPP
jgi:tetratricopeptide (TPR) repeat protein